MSTAVAAPASPIRGTFSRNTLTSIFTTALDFITLTGLVELAGVDYVLATWIGTIVGSLSNFTINRVWAFDASGLHTGGVWIFTRFLGLPYPASKLVVAALVYLAWNYPMNRWVVFNPRFSAPAGGVQEPAA